jgi:hypothetical protein
MVTVRRDPGGMVTLPAGAYITIPAALRRRCGPEAGDQVCWPPSLVRTPSPPTASPWCYPFAGITRLSRSSG